MSHITRLTRALLAVGASASLAAMGCSTPDAANAGKGAASVTGLERDTKIAHEPCDANSAGATKVDVNGDGKPDIIHVMNGSREVCRIVDLNLDGAVDAFIYYDEQGRERRRESDFDRDGRADEIAIYQNGVLVQKQRETNFDDKLDTWDYYENGVLTKRERDSDGDGIVDQWWTFNNPTNPKCAVVASDTNADGKPDPDSVVDLCGDQYGTPKAPAPASSASVAPAAASSAPAAGAPAASGAPSAAPSAAPSTAPSAAPAAPATSSKPPAKAPTSGKGK
jgi:hypothetical protein